MFILELSLLIIIIFSIIILKEKSILIKFYFSITLVAFPLQIVFLKLFNFSHKLYDPKNIDYIFNSLFYVLMYTSCLFATFKLLQKSPNLNFNFGKNKILYLLENNLINNLNIFKIFFYSTFFLIVIAEFSLIGFGSFFANASFLRCSDFTFLINFYDYVQESPNIKKFHQFVKTFAELKYFLMIFVGKIYNSNLNKKKLKKLYYTLLIFVFFLAIIKGSKVMAVLTILIYFVTKIKSLFTYKKFISLISISVLALVISKLIAHARNLYYSDYTLICKKLDLNMVKSLYVQETSLSKSFFIADLFVSRLNYLIPFSRAYEFVIKNGFLDAKIFFFNFIGLVPRILWSEKPLLTNNMDINAHNMSITSAIKTNSDYSNLFSVSFRPEGESFIYFGYYGLLIAILVGLIFFIVEKFNHKRSKLFQTFYLYLVYLVATTEVNFVLLPSLIQSALSYLIFLIIIYVAIKTSKKLL